MAGEFDEQGSPPESPGRNLGGPAHRDRPFAEHREDARIPVETGGDHVRRDREGDGPPTAGGQHRDAGAPAASLGRQARPQEGGQRPSRAFVPTECPLVRNPRAHRPRGTGEDRSHRGESKEAQDLRLGFADRLSVRTLFPVPTRTRSAIFRNRPCPTTPGIASIWPASFSADARLRNRASRMWFPLSVRNASPDARRRSTEAPRDSSDFAAKRQPNGWTSTGTAAHPRLDVTDGGFGGLSLRVLRPVHLRPSAATLRRGPPVRRSRGRRASSRGPSRLSRGPPSPRTSTASDPRRPRTVGSGSP